MAHKEHFDGDVSSAEAISDRLSTRLWSASREVANITNFSTLYTKVESLTTSGTLAKRHSGDSGEMIYYVPDDKESPDSEEPRFAVAWLGEKSYKTAQYDSHGRRTHWMHAGEGSKFPDTIIAEQSTSYHPNGNPAHRESRYRPYGKSSDIEVNDFDEQGREIGKDCFVERDGDTPVKILRRQSRQEWAEDGGLAKSVDRIYRESDGKLQYEDLSIYTMMLQGNPNLKSHIMERTTFDDQGRLLHQEVCRYEDPIDVNKLTSVEGRYLDEEGILVSAPASVLTR